VNDLPEWAVWAVAAGIVVVMTLVSYGLTKLARWVILDGRSEYDKWSGE